MEQYSKLDDNGSRFYYNDKAMDTLHKEDGPAMIWDDGTKAWYVNGQLHREDGPAVEYADGSRSWYFNGKLHRVGGPAIECSDGDREWLVYGKRLTEEEYNVWFFNHVRESTLRKIPSGLC